MQILSCQSSWLLYISYCWSEYEYLILVLTAGWRFETAVPDDVMITAGLWELLAKPAAWYASERSSMHAIQLVVGWVEAAIARGDDRDPGAIQKY